MDVEAQMLLVGGPKFEKMLREETQVLLKECQPATDEPRALPFYWKAVLPIIKRLM